MLIMSPTVAAAEKEPEHLVGINNLSLTYTSSDCILHYNQAARTLLLSAHYRLGLPVLLALK